MSSVHKRHGSPHVASVATSGVALVLNAAIALLGVEPLAFYTAVLGMTSMIALLIISICNVAVFVYMRRNGGQHSSTWASRMSDPRGCRSRKRPRAGSDKLPDAGWRFQGGCGGAPNGDSRAIRPNCFNSRVVPQPETPHVQQHRTPMTQMRIVVAQRVALMRRAWKTTTYSEDM